MDPQLQQDLLEQAAQKSKKNNTQAYAFNQEAQAASPSATSLPSIAQSSGGASSAMGNENSLVTGAPNEPSDVTSAEQYLGSGQGFSGLCERFAEEMTGKGPQGLTAADAFQNQLEKGQAIADPTLSGAKAGDLVYFAADSSNDNDGHVGILTDNGKTFVSATYNGVQAYDLGQWEKSTGQRVTGYVPTTQ